MGPLLRNGSISYLHSVSFGSGLLNAPSFPLEYLPSRMLVGGLLKEVGGASTTRLCSTGGVGFVS